MQQKTTTLKSIKLCLFTIFLSMMVISLQAQKVKIDGVARW